jgi:phage terminase small subunit
VADEASKPEDSIDVELDVDAKALAQTCNEREWAFAREWVIDQNATRSIWRAGCFKVSSDESASVSGARLLARARVKAAIQILMEQRNARIGMTADSVVQEMALLSHSDITHYIVDDSGNVQLAAGAPANAMRAIQSIKRKKTVREDKAGTVTITYDVEIKLWDKPSPLKLMGKQHGLFPDKMELTGKNGAPLEVVSRIERVIVPAPKG